MVPLPIGNCSRVPVLPDLTIPIPSHPSDRNSATPEKSAKPACKKNNVSAHLVLLLITHFHLCTPLVANTLSAHDLHA